MKKMTPILLLCLIGSVNLLTAQDWNQLGADIDGEAADDLSGYSVSINASGDRMAIGAYGNDGNGNASGHVRIYGYNGSFWQQLGADINGEAAFDQSGVSVSLNDTGNRVAIGAPVNQDNGSLSGHVRIYEYNGNVWQQLGSDINGEAAGDRSGKSVSINAIGDRVAIGAWTNDGNGNDSGHVRIYGYNGSAWQQLGADINGEAAFDQSGFSVSMNVAGDRVAIGAFLNDGNGTNSGHVRIYGYNGSTWQQLGADIEGETANDNSGVSVSMNAAGDRVAIGATGNDGNGNNSGHVRIYGYNGSAWQKIGADIEGETANDLSGVSVSINAVGDRVAIGASYNDSNGSDSGHARIYGYDGSAWQQLGADIDGEATGDNSGVSVSMNAAGDRVAIGAFLNDGNGTNSGHVRLYELESVDTEPPVITCPSPITQNAGSNCTAIVSLVDPTATDNVSTLFTFNGVRSDGAPLTDPFFVGETTITWTATDEAGNVSDSCTQKITVNSSGSCWEKVGGDLISAGDADNLSFAKDANGLLYVAYRDYEIGGISVSRFQNGSWETIGGSVYVDNGYLMPHLAVSQDGIPHVSYYDNQQGRHIIKRFINNVWEDFAGVIEGASFEYGDGRIAFNPTNELHILYLTTGNKHTLKKWDGNAWITIGQTAFSNAGLDYRLAFDTSGTPFVSYQETDITPQRLTVQHFNGMDWEFVGTAAFTQGIGAYHTLGIAPNDLPYVAYYDSGGTNIVKVARFNGTDWEQVGNSPYQGEVTSLSIDFDAGGTPYIGFKGNPNIRTVVRLENNVWVTLGQGIAPTGTNDFFENIQICLDNSDAQNPIVYAFYAQDGIYAKSYQADLLDTEAPQITCPDPIFVGSIDGNAVSVSLIDPTATDNETTAVNIIFEGIRGDGLELSDDFPIGETTITWTATDEAGNNSESCEQIVTVFQVETTAVLNPDGSLNLEDVNGGISNDQFVLSIVGDNLRITSSTAIEVMGPGTVQIDANTIEVPLSSLTGGLTIDGKDGDDLLIINTPLSLLGSDNGLSLSNIDVQLTGSGLLQLNALNVTNGDFNTSDLTTEILTEANFYENATLSGTGTINGTVNMNVDSNLAPGTSPGILNTGDLTLDNNNNDFEVNGPTPGTEHDQIVVTGTVTVVSGTTLNLLGGYLNTPSDEIILIDNDGTDAIIGIFDGLPEGETVSFGDFNGIISYVGGDGNDITLKSSSSNTTPLIITEIMYNPNSAEDDWEWIEIYNPGTTDLDISGYVIDDINSVAHTSANIASGIVSAGSSVVLYNSEDISETDFLAAWGDVVLVPVTNWGAMSLNNGGDTIGIWDSFASYSGDNVAQSNVIEQVTYETTGWPVDNGTSSVFLTDLNADNTIGSNWTLSTDGGATPLFEGYTSKAAGGNSGADIGSPGTPVLLGSITIFKDVDDDSFADMMFDFSFGGIPFSISENTTEGYVFENLLPGNYEITELVPYGWDLVSINAGAGNNNTALPNGLTVVLEAGENAVVTFNNVYVPIPAIVINEILADPPVDLSGDANGDGTRDASQDEFIEIVNLEDSDIDISGWTISDAVGVRHTFPANTILASNCGAVIFGGGTPTGQFGGMAVQTASSGSLGINNGGDVVVLSDDEGTVIATYTYVPGGANDQSLTRDPDGTGTEPLVPHSTASGSGGSLFSPGTMIDGNLFAGCEIIAPPVITCPMDLTIRDDESTDPGNTGTATSTGGVGDVTITWVDVVANDGTITRTWTATDEQKNTSSCVQVITVENGICSIMDISVSNISACNDPGTLVGYPFDDTFTADVTVSFTSKPDTGNLILAGDGTGSIAVSDIGDSSYTFQNVVMSANGTPIDLTANFSEAPDCSLKKNDLGSAPEPCSSTFCSILAIEATNISDCNDQGTSDPSDDTFTADVTVGFTNIPASGTLNLSSDATASVQVAELTGSSYTFTGVVMSSKGGFIRLTAAFSENLNCNLTNSRAGAAPEACSVSPLEIICPGNITVSNDPGLCGTNVSFSEPTVSGNNQGVTFSASPSSGSYFPVGTTTVNVTAEDAAGNTSTCSFDVTVNDTEAPKITVPEDLTLRCPEELPTIPAPSVNILSSTNNLEGTYRIGTASFGAPLTSVPITGELALADDGFGNVNDACESIVNDLTGKIAVIDRGSCDFVIKVYNAQNAGALAVIVVNNLSGLPIAMGGTDPRITIPSVIVSKDYGDALKTEMQLGIVTVSLTEQIISVIDNCFDLTVDFKQTIAPGNTPFDYTILNTWTVVDKANNTNSATQKITVIEAEKPKVEITGRDSYCHDGNGVELDAGAGFASYLWSPGGQTTRTITALEGSYTVTVTNEFGCESTSEAFIVTNNEPLTCSIVQDVLTTDHETEDGAATVNPKGGTGEYTYLWDNGEKTRTATKLTYGMHWVTVTDSNGCETSCQVDIAKELYCWTNLIQNVSVKGGSDGAARAMGNGGYAPYTFKWDDGSTDATNDKLTAGTHFVTITDALGETSRCSVTIEEPNETNCSQLICSIEQDVLTMDHLTRDGVATVYVKGGTGQYTYLWDNGETAQQATTLTYGMHSVTVTDANGCETTCQIDIAKELYCWINLYGNVSVRGGNDGSAMVHGNGGYRPFTFQWDDGTTSQLNTNLKAGTHYVTITDATGATSRCGITVTEPNAEVCDGVDNDGDGEIDEGFDKDGDGIADCYDDCDDTIDTDQDGVPDCRDVCPGFDDTLDSDGDGTPDGCDIEVCDGVDNDGDGEVDEGFDKDGDGTADCFDECDDSIDTDQDGVPDCRDVCPGFDDTMDSDGDGTPDGCDIEVCDGLDNDGDGDIDEGFDQDGDGIADCFDECDDSIDTDQDGVPDCKDICPGGDDNLDTDGDGTPDFCDDCDDLDDDGDGVRNCEDVCPGGDDMADSDGDGIPDACDEEVCDGVDNDGDGDIDEGLNCDPGSIDQCETAFARSSDENVRTCFLNIPNINGNRWGWTNEFPSIDGVYEMDLYAAAGQCDISKGALVGSVQVVYSGGSVSVTVSTLGGYKMTEAQLYVGSNAVPAKPNNGNLTVAPGDYPYEDNISGDFVTHTFPGVSAGDMDSFYVILHAEVCPMDDVAKYQAPTLELSGYPVPFKEDFTLVVISPREMKSELSLYDGIGKRVQTFGNYYLKKGRNEIGLRTNELPAGMYYVYVTTGSGKQILKVLRRP